METDFLPARWRIIRHHPLPGALNMAIDEAILEAIGRSEALPTLRFYAWHPACLSLGYAQPHSDVDQEALEAAGWDLVRRPTGGRAILHTDELTYSVIGPESEPRLSGGVLRSYHNISQALLYGLRLLQIPAEALETPELAESSSTIGENKGKNPICFEVPSNYEITVLGKKLVGSAQARRKDGVLQHGSLPLSGDLTRIIRVLKFPDWVSREYAAERLLDRAMTTEMAAGENFTWDTIADTLTQAFQQTLNLEFVFQDLSAREEERAAVIAEEKFRNFDWTFKI